MNERGVSFTAVLLAGGESRRMGLDKAVLNHRNGLSFWQQQIHVLEQVDPDYIMISAPRQPDWISEEMIWVADDTSGGGPISGIAGALKICSTSHLICLGIDLIQMGPDELKYFITCSTNGVGLVPRSEAGWEPLAAIFPREATEVFNQALAAGEYKLQAVMDTLLQQGMIRPYPIPQHEGHFYQNINTPEEYQAWISSME